MIIIAHHFPDHSHGHRSLNTDDHVPHGYLYMEKSAKFRTPRLITSPIRLRGRSYVAGYYNLY